MDKRAVMSKLYAKISDTPISRKEASRKYAITSSDYDKILSQTPGSLTCFKLMVICNQLQINIGV